MAQLIVDIGDYKISSASDLIKTFALGSCVAVAVYDAQTKTGGMIHIALPDSSIDKEKALKEPAYFVDSGLPLFFKEYWKLGVNRRNARIKLIGGAKIMDAEGVFDIGRRNVLAVKKLLWKNNLGIVAEDVGGSISRTVSLDLSSGELLISNKGKTWKL